MKRPDGRNLDQLRKITVVLNYITYPEGSCLIEMGATKIICTATVDKNVPLFLRNSGTGWVTAEYRMLPRATQTRVQRDKVSGRNMEIQRLIGRSLRSVVDLKKMGERTVVVDCDVIQADGGTRIASVIGGFIALGCATHSLYRQGVISQLCITDLLGAISVGVSQGKTMLDLTYQEDSSASIDMNVVMRGAGEFIELQGTAERGAFSEPDLSAFLKLAKKGIGEIFALERDLLKDILPPHLIVASGA